MELHLDLRKKIEQISKTLKIKVSLVSSGLYAFAAPQSASLKELSEGWCKAFQSFVVSFSFFVVALDSLAQAVSLPLPGNIDLGRSTQSPEKTKPRNSITDEELDTTTF